MKKSFTVEIYVDVEIPDNKISEVVKDFRESIDSTATITEVMEHIAWNEATGGGFCEGVGENGKDFTAFVTGNDVEED
jgi:hypothetical protein